MEGEDKIRFNRSDKRADSICEREMLSRAGSSKGAVKLKGCEATVRSEK